MTKLKDIPVNLEPGTCSRCGKEYTWTDMRVIVVHGCSRLLCEDCMDKLDKFLCELNENRKE